MQKSKDKVLSHEQLTTAIDSETRKFQECYLWLEKSMPRDFFKEIDQESIMLITHNLMDFPLQDFFSTVNLKRAGIAMCLDSTDATAMVAVMAGCGFLAVLSAMPLYFSSTQIAGAAPCSPKEVPNGSS